jgi:hypothetical protein
MKSNAFGDGSANFTIYFLKGASGFTSPQWKGYPSVEIDEAPNAIRLSQKHGSHRKLISASGPLHASTGSHLLLGSLEQRINAVASDLESNTSTVVIDGQRFLTITVKTPTARKSLVEVSPDLVNWFSGPHHTTAVTDNASLLKVRDNTPLAAGEKRFIRVRTTGR